jgi:hypothetical protein
VEASLPERRVKVISVIIVLLFASPNYAPRRRKTEKNLASASSISSSAYVLGQRTFLWITVDANQKNPAGPSYNRVDLVILKEFHFKPGLKNNLTLLSNSSHVHKTRLRKSRLDFERHTFIIFTY